MAPTELIDPIDPIDVLVPNYIEFARMNGPKEALAAVQRFFASSNATLEHFVQYFGVDLTQFSGFYLEVDAVDAPVGPLVPGKVKPILVLRQSKSGASHTPHVMNHEGFMTVDGTTAWVDARLWDKHVQDTLLDEVKEAARKKREQMQREAKHKERKADQDGKEA
jgi:hypothetical protein